jgi:hypothetical protein
MRAEWLERRTLLSVSILNGSGLGYAGDNAGGDPPDTTGAAGPSSYIESTNAHIEIFPNKTDGTTVVSQTSDNFFFSSLIGNETQVDAGSQRIADVTLLFDNLMGGTGRFFIGNIDIDKKTNISQYVFAVSKSNNPTTLTTADWTFYHIGTTESSGGSTSWSDYPGNPGYNADAIVDTFNMFGPGPNDCQVVSINAADLANRVPQASLRFYRSDVPGGASNYRPTTMQDSVPGGPMWLIHNPDDGTSVDVVKMTSVLSNSPSFSTTSLSLPAAAQYPNLAVFPENPDSTIIQTDGLDQIDGAPGNTTNSASVIDDRIYKAAEYNNTVVATCTVPVGTAFLVAASLQLDGANNPIGGSGYQVGDILTVSGGTFAPVAKVSVATLGAGGSIATVTVSSAGVYSSTLGINGSVTGGHGNGALFNFRFGGQRDVEWYAFNVSGASPVFQSVGGVANVGQFGFGVNTYCCFSGISINSAGQIGLSYTESDTVGGAVNPATQGFVSTFVTARTPTDAAGTMQPWVLVPAGIGYGNIGDRAGDFSGLSVDPVNGTFWAANQFGIGSHPFDLVGDPADDIVNFSPTVTLFAYLSGTTLEIPGLGNNNNTLTVSLSGGTYSATDITPGGPVTLNFAASAVTSINMTLGSGTNTVFYGSGSLTGFAAGNLDLGSGFSNTLTIDDSQYGANTAYTFDLQLFVPRTPIILTRSAFFGGVSYLDVSRVNFDAGFAQDATNVYATPMGATTYIYSAGVSNSVTVGYGLVQNIKGPVNIQNSLATDGDVTVDDSTDSAAHTVSVANASTSGFGAVFGLTPAEVDYNYADIDNGLTILLDNHANLVNVHQTGSVATTFVGGQAKSFQMEFATATLSGMTITGATTGGLSNLGTMTVVNCTISNNTSLLNGGIYNSGTMTMTNSKVTGNSAPQSGGGVYNTSSGSLFMANCLISGNSAGGKGGGIYNQGGLTVINTTISGNSASGGGPGFYNAGNALLENSILYSDVGSELVNTGNLTVNYSDIQSGWTGPGTHNLPASSSPNFDGNFNLQFPSPCIDTGNNSYVYGLNDLASNKRIVGPAVDMGAYESLGPISLVYAPGPPGSVTVNTTFPQVVVDVEQGGGITHSQNGTTVTLTLNASFFASAIVDSNGQAKFPTNLVFPTTGNFVLTASDGSDGTASAQVTVTPAASTLTLGWISAPASAVSGQPVSSFQVEVLNGGLVAPGDTSFISIYLDGVGTALDTEQVGAVNPGYAVFSHVVIPPGTSAGPHFLQARDPGDGVTPITSNIQINAPAPVYTLFFGPPPNFAAVGNALNPAITVYERVSDDPNSALVPDSTTSVTLSVSGGTLSGDSLTKQLSGGSISFTETPTANGTYSITAHDGTAHPATLSFTVNPEHLVFNFPSQTMPNFVQGSNQFLNSFTVSVVQNGSVVNTDTSNISVSVLVPNPAAYTPRTSSTNGTGVAQFSTMFSNGFFIGSLSELSNIVLYATDSNINIAPGESASFAVTPAAPHTLAVSGGGTTAAGTSVSPGFQFQLSDAFGDSIFGDTSSATASITDGPAGGAFDASSTLTEPLNFGFNNLVFNRAGAYTVLFTDAADGLSVSTGVTITGGPATHLVFMTEPGNTSTDYPIDPPIVVAAEDSFNDVSTFYTGTITLSGIPDGTQLNGTVSVAAQNGMATFSDISISQQGTYTLSAVDSVVSSISGMSNSFVVSAPVTIHVDKNAAAGGDGLTWSTAYTNLQTALSVAVPGDTIDVAQGDYSPGATPTSTFALLDGVTIQGGFATGTHVGPDPTLYPTTLDGMGTNYHVVTGSGTNSTAILEGFTITGGNANGGGNADSFFGGGLIVDGGSPTITHCVFTSNTAATSAGALYDLNSSPALLDCRFLSNTAPTGGAIYNQGSNPTLLDCLFAGNSATSSGGAMYDDGSSPTVTNCTFTANTAAAYGGAMENENASVPTLTNCIFWQNSALGGGSDIANDQVTFSGASQPVINHSDVNFNSGYVGTSFTGNIANLNDIDPLFVNAAGGNYQLQPASPCINAGDDNAPALPGTFTDLAGNSRFIDGVADIGAYEAVLPSVVWNGLGDGINWSDPANWSDDLVPTQNDDAIVPSGFGQITVGAGSYAAHSLTSASSILIDGGAFTLSIASTISNSLTIQNGGTLGIGDQLIVTETLAILRGQIAAGQIFSTVDGLVVGSLDAGGGHSEADPTLLGDTDLDHRVNVADLANLAGNFGKTAGATWLQGDFDYNGIVNVADLADLAGNFGQSLGGGGGGGDGVASSPANKLAIAPLAPAPPPPDLTASAAAMPFSESADSLYLELERIWTTA